MKRNLLALLLCLGACNQPTSSNGPETFPDIIDSSKSDGLQFTRVLDPQLINLNADRQTHEGSFDPKRYVAYSFDAAAPSSLVFQLSYAMWSNLVHVLRDTLVSTDPDRSISFALFRRNLSAKPNAPASEVWDLVDKSPDLVEGDLHYYSVVQPGRFLLVVLAGPLVYSEALDYRFDIGATALNGTVGSPGAVAAQVVLSDGRPVANERIAIGTASAVTDGTGQALLKGIEAGSNLVRLGPQGLGRAVFPTGSNLFVWGDGYVHKQLFIVP